MDEVSKVARFVGEGRVKSLNAERSKHWSQKHQATAHWREMFGWLGSTSKQNFCRVSIVAEIVQKKPLMDTGNCYPSVKAAIDGLVDAGILPDDKAENVESITMLAPRAAKKGEAETLTLILEGF